jgi:hypothetical protein
MIDVLVCVLQRSQNPADRMFPAISGGSGSLAIQMSCAMINVSCAAS